jgi:hypothetical protein
MDLKSSTIRKIISKNLNNLDLKNLPRNIIKMQELICQVCKHQLIELDRLAP